MDIRIALAVLPVLLVLAGLQHGVFEPAPLEVERSVLPRGNTASANPRPAVATVAAPTAAPAPAVATSGFNPVFRSGPSGELLLDAGAAERLALLLDREHGDDGAVVPEQAVRTGLAPAQAAQATALLQAMRRLRADEAALYTRPGRGTGPETAAVALRELAALRQRHFGADAQALFGAEQERQVRQIDALRAEGAPQPGG